MKINKIKVGARHRKDMGDIAALASSIESLGLLHPPVVDANGNLLAGARRLSAVKVLGWDDVAVTVARKPKDLHDALRAERDENTQRKDFTPSEAVEMARAIEPFEQKDAAKRQEQSRSNRGGKFPPRSESERGKAGDRVAAAVGMSRPTLEKATAVVKAAEDHPKQFGDLVEKMDERDNVSGAYNELVERQSKGAPKTETPRNPTKKIDQASNAVPLDAVGVPLPDRKDLREAFGDRGEFDVILGNVKSIAAKLNKLTGDGEKKKPRTSAAHLDRQRASTDLKNFRLQITFAKPHAVCPHCRGKGCPKNTGCRGLGWMTEEQYKRVPADLVAAIKRKGAA